VVIFQPLFRSPVWPLENGGELPVLLCFVFLFFAAFGAGSFSLDELLARNKESVQAERSIRVA
jgi:putative oxidoreductase